MAYKSNFGYLVITHELLLEPYCPNFDVYGEWIGKYELPIRVLGITSIQFHYQSSVSYLIFEATYYVQPICLNRLLLKLTTFNQEPLEPMYT